MINMNIIDENKFYYVNVDLIFSIHIIVVIIKRNWR